MAAVLLLSSCFGCGKGDASAVATTKAVDDILSSGDWLCAADYVGSNTTLTFPEVGVMKCPMKDISIEKTYVYSMKSVQYDDKTATYTMLWAVRMKGTPRESASDEEVVLTAPEGEAPTLNYNGSIYTLEKP